MSDDDPAPESAGGRGDDPPSAEGGDTAPPGGGPGDDTAPPGGGPGDDIAPPDGDDPGPVRRFRESDSGAVTLVRDVLSSALMVVLVAGLLFGASGVWPPMVAVKSGSMNPHMEKGDLVFVTEEHRFAGDAAVEETGVVTHQAGRDAGYRKFGAAGDVIVYRPNNATTRDPIIHRAMFYVEEGENWYDRANGSHLRADDCGELANCPARNAGFITKGDNPESNQYYDQARGMSRPVKPAWIEAKAMVRIPALGWIRLKWAEFGSGAASAGLAATAAAGLLGRRRSAA
jgi:signal peptidase